MRNVNNFCTEKDCLFVEILLTKEHFKIIPIIRDKAECAGEWSSRAFILLNSHLNGYSSVILFSHASAEYMWAVYTPPLPVSGDVQPQYQYKERALYTVVQRHMIG